MHRACWFSAVAIIVALPAQSPAASPMPEERDGYVEVEAERFSSQEKTDKRRWHLLSATEAPEAPDVSADGDLSHAASASAGAYLEVLPDTRRTHDDRLVAGENFSNKPGEMAVLTYAVTFRTAGRYYVWVRAFSTGTEDNGIHVGLNGEWPSTGARMQWCEGKNSWRWASKQRTAEQHCGVSGLIYLDIPAAGVHTVQFSMREDGFEFDKFILTTDPKFAPPEENR